MIITDIVSIHQYQTTRAAWENFAPRQHHYLAYQVTGRYDHTVDGKVYSASAGKLLFINKKDSYSVKRFEQGYSICAVFSADTDTPTGVWDMRANPVVYDLFLRLLQLKNLEDKRNYYLAFSILYEIFSILCKTEQPQKPTDSPAERISLAVEYIAEHFADGEIKNETLAKLCGVSEKYFRTLFKQRYQTTPTQYIINLRLNTAVKYLDYGGYTVAEIAEAVGIPDVYYFSKLFKRKFSVSPSNYKRNLL